MPDPIPSCFRCGAVGVPPASTATGPSLTTSIYETRLGLAALSWSRTVLGLSLRADLRCAGGGAAAAMEEENDEDEETLRFRIRPWLLWKRRGSKRFHLKDHLRHRTVDFSWDLTRARFPAGGGPEPSAWYFVAVAVDGEMLLVSGDLVDRACRRTKAARGKSPWNSIMISRREHVALGDSGGGRSYKTRARFGGKEREISIDLGTKEKERDVGMWLGVDGRSVLQVRRLKWKFRGSERVEVESGTQIQVSWDLYNWFFKPKDKPHATASTAAAAADLGHAVFVFRFEWEAGEERHFVKGSSGPARGVYHKGIGGFLGKNRNRSQSSSGDGGGGGGEEGRRRRRGRKKSLLKMGSSSPSSSASSASSLTVMEWASPEETELQSADGFLLLVHAWKS